MSNKGTFLKAGVTGRSVTNSKLVREGGLEPPKLYGLNVTTLPICPHARKVKVVFKGKQLKNLVSPLT